MSLARGVFQLAFGARPPTTEGTIAVTGLHAPLTIRRDEHGVPYVEAENDEDAFFGVGFCQAQDRAFQIELLVRVVRGTLAELVGPEMLDTDKLARRIDFAGIAERQLARADPSTRATLDAFARGVNAGLARGATRKCHELALLGAVHTRYRASDTLAVLQFLAFALSSNWDAELARLKVLRGEGIEALVALEPSLAAFRADLAAADRLLADVDALRAAEALEAGVAALGATKGLAGASNAWAISAARTATGRPLLASDPHLSPVLPAPWHLVHVRSPGVAFTGACFVTQPVPSIGHNAHVAFGITAAHVDNSDLFVERLGADGRSVLDGDRFVACEVRREVIRVKGGPDVVLDVLVTPRGPIVGPALGESRDALSLRGTWMAARPPGGYGLVRARDVAELRACFVSYPGPSECRVFADVHGAIAWQVHGDAPRRRRGHGLVPQAGWDPGGGWEDEPRPLDTLPHGRDPDRGFVATANQRPADLDPATFLGVDWLDGYRYDRIVERLAARTGWTVEDCLALQIDRRSLLWRELAEPFLAATAGDVSVDVAIARSLLAAWDGDVAPDAPAASVFEIALADLACRIARARAPSTWRAALGEKLNELLPHGTMPLRRIAHLSRLLREQPAGFFASGWPAEIRAALAGAVSQLRARHGPAPDTWRWGDVRPLRLRHPVAAKAPFDRIFALRDVAIGGDVTTVAQASIDFQSPLGDPIGVANLRAVIDVGAWENSRWSLAGGESGNPCSPHFGDLLDRWERGDGITIAWSAAEVRRRARSTLSVVPG